MTEFQRYLAEEVAEDHADGLVSRREALRRLGCSGSAARRRLVARGFAADEARRGRAPAPRRGERRQRRTAAAAADARDHVSRARRPDADGRLGGGGEAPGGVLVIHENRGLNDSIRSIAGRLAASGYSALAIDLLSEEGGTGSFADEFEAMAALGAAPPSRFVADMKAGVTELRAPPSREEGRGDRASASAAA